MKVLVFLWGLAEATLFFLVPDVPVSFVALEGRRNGLTASLLAVAGALLGGSAMYAWGDAAPADAIAALDDVPAIDRAMIERVEKNLESHGIVALFSGPFTGTPYKIYAVQAAAVGMHPLKFLLVSIPARLLRFALVSLIVSWISTRWLPEWTRRRKAMTLAGFWLLFYAVFFSLMP